MSEVENELNLIREKPVSDTEAPCENEGETTEKQNTEELSPVSKESFIGFVLIFSAGWINIQGIKFGIVDSLSYVTGRGVRIGMAMFEGDYPALLYALGAMISYVLGAYIGARAVKERGIGFALLMTSFFLLIVSMNVILKDYGYIFDSNLSFEETFLIFSMFLTLISMGSMNGATSMTSIGRTTHLTGAATDIGLNFALGKNRTAIFHLLRWVGFFMGAFVGMCFYGLQNHMTSFLTLIPVIVIVTTGVSLCMNAKKDL